MEVDHAYSVPMPAALIWLIAALVLAGAEAVARDEGQVKLDGQVWTARPLNDGDVYEPGQSVTVVRIDGATAVVFQNL